MSGKAKNAGPSAASWHWHLKNAPAGSSIASQVFSNGVQTIDALVKQGLNAQAAESAADKMLKKSGLISLSVTLG